MKRFLCFSPPFCWTALLVFLGLFAKELNAADASPPRTPLLRAVDLDANEAQEVQRAIGHLHVPVERNGADSAR